VHGCRRRGGAGATTTTVAPQRGRSRRRGRGEEAVHAAVAPVSGAADAVGPREVAAGVDVCQLKADATAWLAVAWDGKRRQQEEQAEEKRSLGGH